MKFTWKIIIINYWNNCYRGLFSHKSLSIYIPTPIKIMNFCYLTAFFSVHKWRSLRFVHSFLTFILLELILIRFFYFFSDSWSISTCLLSVSVSTFFKFSFISGPVLLVFWSIFLIVLGNVWQFCAGCHLKLNHILFSSVS